MRKNLFGITVIPHVPDESLWTVPRPRPRVSPETQRVILELETQVQAAKVMFGATRLGDTLRAAIRRLLELETIARDTV